LTVAALYLANLLVVGDDYPGTAFSVVGRPAMHSVNDCGAARVVRLPNAKTDEHQKRSVMTLPSFNKAPSLPEAYSAAQKCYGRNGLQNLAVYQKCRRSS
jgi:hypothetical protein